MLSHIRRIIDVTTWEQTAGTQPQGPHLPSTWHRLELLTSGRAWSHTAAGDSLAEAGDVVWDGPGERCLHRTGPAGFGAFLVTVEVEPGTPRDGPRVSRWGDLLAARSAAREWMGLWHDGLTPRHDLGLAIFARLRLVALRHQAQAVELPSVLRRTLARIEEDYVEPLGVVELAREAGCSTSRLHALFQIHLGSTPHRQIHERRLQAARTLLVSTTAPLAEIAQGSGFSDAATLCRAFRREFGVTPAAWRAANY